MWNRIKYHWTCLTKPRRAPITLGSEFRAPMAGLLAYMAPSRAEGVKKKRYGSRFDGGYVMLDDFAAIAGAYSLGIGGNVKWDLAMAQKGLPVWQYDHTVGGSPHSHELFVFNKVRIGATAEPTTPTVPLDSLVGERGSGDLILKIDIEGDEWEVFAQIDPDRLQIFRQILVEFHDFPRITDPVWREQAMRAMDHLTRYHRVVHVHGNNFAALVSTADIQLPNGLEVTLVRKDAYRLVPTDETFPGPGDGPNNPFWPNVPLGRFRFDGAK